MNNEAVVTLLYFTRVGVLSGSCKITHYSGLLQMGQ